MTDAPTPTRAAAAALRLPAGSCDAHVHVFGPAARFPFAPQRSYTPAEAPKEALFALHRQLGIDRCVIVQPTCHGFDNAVTEDAIAASEGRCVGVALVPLDVSDAELARLANAGFRGVRFHFVRHLDASADAEALVPFAQRLVPFRMHLQVHFEASMVHALAGPLSRSPVPVVIDHIARVDAALGPAHRDFAAVRALLANPLLHIKLSGVDRISRGTDYRAAIALAELLLREHPAQCVWGTDWPHPNHDHVPEDGRLVDLVAQIAPDADLRHRLLVRNPQALYRFNA